MVVSVLVLLFLAGVTVLLTMGGTSPSNAAADGTPVDPAPSGLRPLVSFEPERLTLIEVSQGGATARVAREVSSGWRYSADDGLEWPASLSEQSMRALAEIATLRPTQGAQLGEVEATLVLGSGDGAPPQMLEVGPAGLGGRTPLRRSERPGDVALAPTEVIDVLVREGPASWRSRGAAPGVRDASRVSLITPTGPLTLAKLNGRWYLRAPVGVRADERAVASLLDALGALRIESFIDEGRPTPEASGLESPALIISWEIDRRVAGATDGDNVRVATDRRQIIVGGPADTTGALLHASLDDELRLLARLSASEVSSISTAARNYIEPTITDVRPADVFMLTIGDEIQGGERAFRRDVDGWIEVLDGDNRTEASADAIEGALEFLASRPGEPELPGDPDELQIVKRISLYDRSGDPLELISVGFTADGVLGFRLRDLLVMFDDAGVAPELFELPRFSSLPERNTPSAPAELPASMPREK